MEILLIRHGETDWNRELVFRGRRDIPLSERGRRQADLLARSLSNLKIDAVYSSPLSRAVQTAEPLAAALGLSPVPVTELVDVDFGEWTGLSRDEVREEYKADFQEWLENPLSVTFLGGESVAEAGRRCFDWLSRLAASDSRRVAVVTHRVILKLLLLHMLKAPGSAFWQVQFDTCSITTVTRDEGSFRIESLNDTHHLDSIDDRRLPDF